MRSPRPMRATTDVVVTTASVVKRNRDDASRMRGEDADVDTFGKRLQWLSGFSGSETAFALACGLTHSAISTAIRKDSASMETVRRIHEVTGVDLTWLICGEGSPGTVRAPRTAAEGIAERTRRPSRRLEAHPSGDPPTPLRHTRTPKRAG